MILLHTCLRVLILCVLSVHFIVLLRISFYFFFFKQKTAYEMRISDWSSDVCSSDLIVKGARRGGGAIDLARAQYALGIEPVAMVRGQIGRASCRERVCQYV